jgi:hypothetical protein
MEACDAREAGARTGLCGLCVELSSSFYVLSYVVSGFSRTVMAA